MADERTASFGFVSKSWIATAATITKNLKVYIFYQKLIYTHINRFRMRCILMYMHITS